MECRGKRGEGLENKLTLEIILGKKDERQENMAEWLVGCASPLINEPETNIRWTGKRDE